MKDTKQIGDTSTAMVVAALLQAGHTVLTPFGDRHRYDLVIELSSGFKKVQCKTGRSIRGSIVFNLYSVVRDAKSKKWVHKQYGNTVDFYGVYSADWNKSYMIPVEVIRNKAEGRLLIAKTELFRYKDILLAEDYEISGDVPER